jgi:hypothetical protein
LQHHFGDINKLQQFLGWTRNTYGIKENLQFLGCIDKINNSSEILMAGAEGEYYLYAGGELALFIADTHLPLQLEFIYHMDRLENPNHCKM